MDLLRVEGTKITAPSGKEVRLRGFSFASWLNFENFIIGVPGNQSGVRQAMANVLGEAAAKRFFTAFLRHFVSEEDFRLIRGMGCNLVRIPFNYHYFESDDAPEENLTEGFIWLDRAVEWARKHQIYIILDLHAAPGCQNSGFFSDNMSGLAFLWQQRAYQERVVRLWRRIALHYRGEPAIAGYDLLNEPIPDSIEQLNQLYRRIIAAVREVDADHILFLEGDSYSTQFDGLAHPFDNNVVYSHHVYYPCGMERMEYPGRDPKTGIYYDIDWLRQDYARRTAFMRRNRTPVWFGETSLTFPPEVSEDARLCFLRDLLAVVEECGDSWSFGIYKDIGRTGIVWVDPESPWMKTTAPVREAMEKLHCNSFADLESGSTIHRLCGEMGNHAKEIIGDLAPSLNADQITESIRFRVCECVLPALLTEPFARQFADCPPAEMEQIMASFDLKNCRRREGWIRVIQSVAGSESR